MFFLRDSLVKKSINSPKILISINSGRMVGIRILIRIYIRR
jgi:hypothetical protein